MAPPKLVDQLTQYSSKLSQAKRFRSNDYDDTWRRMRDMYKGQHWESGGDEDQLIVNMIFATVNVINPSVSVNNPRFTVSARKEEHEAQAMFAEEVVNYIWQTNKYQQQFRLCVNDWLMFGHGWMKVGYKWVKDKPKVRSADPPSTDVSDEGIDDREDHEGNVESETNVIDDRPYAERISPFDVFVDPEAHTQDDMAWIAQRVRRPVNDVRVDERYPNKSIRTKVNPTTNSRFGEDTTSSSDNLSPTGAKDKGYVDVIEFYDIKRKKWCVFVDGQTEGFLRNPEDMPYPFGHPFMMLRNYEVPDEFYPIGELEQLEPLQLELNDTRTQQINHRRRYGRKYLYMEDALDDVGVQALESDEDNTMVPVNAGQDLNRVIIPMPSIGVPPDFYSMSNVIEDDMDKVSGVSDYMRGDQPNIRRTATEAAMIQDAANSRAQDKMSRIESFLAGLGARLIQLLQEYMTGTQVVRIVGNDAMPVWIKYDKDYIAGEFDMSVEAGSTQPQNESFKRQSALQLVDAMAPFVQAGVVDVPELAKYILQTGFGIKNPDAFINAAPTSPMEEAQQAEQGALPPGQPQPGQPAPAQGQPAGPAPAPQPGQPGMAPQGAPADPMAGLTPDMIAQLQQLFQQLPPEAQQEFAAQLAQIPPERRAAFVQEVLTQFAAQQAGAQQGAGPPPPGGPPPGMAPGGPPPGAPGQPPPGL